MSEAVSTEAPSGVRYLQPDPSRIRPSGTDEDWPEGLSESHRDYFRKREVSSAVAYQRGVYSITSSRDLPDVAGGRWSPDVRKALDVEGNTAMVFPMFSAITGEGGAFQIKLDQPRIVVEEGKASDVSSSGRAEPKTRVIKFETPTGIKTATGTLYADINPGAGSWHLVKDDSPLVITEGFGKADAILTARLREGIVVTAIMLTGVNAGYCSTKTAAAPKSPPVLAPSLVPLIRPGRPVYMAYDADWVGNKQVALALRTMGQLLEAAGAVVYLVDVPQVEGDPKSGIDDYLAQQVQNGAPSPLADLLGLAKPLGDVFPGRHLAVVRDVEISDGETALLPALIDAFNGTLVQMTGDAVAIIGGPDHGLWTKRQVWNEKKQGYESVDNRVTDWVAWRHAVTATLTADDDGRETPVGEPMYAVTLVTKFGRKFVVENLSAKNSVIASIILDGADAAVALPLSDVERGRCANMLRELGQTDQSGRSDLREFAAGGWLIDPNAGPVMLAPAGSVTADGVTHAFTVGPPVGSEENSLNAAQMSTGWDHVAEGVELRQAIGAFNALIAVAPGRPEIGVALLGAMAAAPLCLTRRASLVLVAEPHVGKSLVLSAAQEFWAETGANGADFTFSFGDSSAFAAGVTASWARHGVVFADDYRISGDFEADRIADAAITVLSQGVYSGARGTKGTREGGIRKSVSIRAVAIISAETAPTATAVVERVVIINIERGDIPQEQPAGIDLFRDGYATTGAARAAWASYLRFLARKIRDNPAGLKGLGREADGVRRDYFQKVKAERAGETVAVIAAGWSYLREWAASEGFADLLPSAGVVTAGLDKLVHGNLASHKEAQPHVVLLNRLRELIEGGKVYINDWDGGTPDEAQSRGWRRDQMGGHGESKWTAAGTLGGYLSSDGADVVILPGGMNFAQSSLGLALKTAQVDRSLKSAGYHGGRADRAPERMGIKGRPRGWIISAARLGIERVVGEVNATAY
jgi:hypothetical protein